MGLSNNNNGPSYHPTSKPNTAAAAAAATSRKRHNLYTIALIVCLCSLSYLLGAWQRGAAGSSGISIGTKSNFQVPTEATSSSPCLPAAAADNLTLPNPKPAAAHLDFTSHHEANSGEEATERAPLNFPACDVKYSEYTPCQDRQRSWKFNRDRLIYIERHCPEKNEVLRCRVPAPHGYRNPFRWPVSRELAWYANVPHKELTVEKAVQNWIRFEGDRFRFPGGGTMFPNGADAYIDDIGKLINLQDGSIRTAIDTGCGVASWGAYLLSRSILTMSFAPRDSHEAQVQFALERGVPALIGVMASERLPYPSRAFDMAHCSRCLIPWGQYDGTYLIEVDRVLRPGGYWILSGPPINWKKHHQGWQRTEEDLNAEQGLIEKVAKSLCWQKLVEENDIAIWQKPINHFNCMKYKRLQQTPSFCPAQDPDRAWYTKMETCLTHLPEVSNAEETAGGAVAKWPERLSSVPPRITMGTIKGVDAEVFRKDSELWKTRLSYYKTVNTQLAVAGRYRNLLDMNANLGGFAAALVEDPLWVMNVVPAEAEVNTLGVIYERGLIGTYQNWCEAMSTYPRTYDLIHADSVFTLYKDRCEMEDILLEMDRILRPEGSVIIRDDVDNLIKVKRVTDGMNWASKIVDHESGPLQREKLLFAVKSYWTAPSEGSATNSSSS